MHVRAVRSARLALLVLALGAVPALAQEPAVAQDNDDAAAADGPPLSDEESALLGQALNFDPSALAGHGPARPLKVPALKRPQTFDVSRSNSRPDGSGTVSVKQTLSPDWDAKVGADVGLASNDPVAYHPQQPLDAYTRNGSGGAAWASVGLTDNASVDARVDPANDQGRLAGTLKHSLPIGSDLSLTLRNTASVTDTYGTLGPSAPAGLPVMALPKDGGTTPSQVFGNEQAVKFDVLPTGTSLAAGLTTASNDPVTHNKLSAEQKLLGPLSVTTSVTDVGQTTANKSITAGFKLNW
jgi:hypothetical protein